MGRKLYVGNLPYQTGETELTELFSRAGTVESARIMRDMATGRARGFGFVEMASDEEAQKAIADLNEFQVGGRVCTEQCSLRDRDDGADRKLRATHPRRFGDGDDDA